MPQILRNVKDVVKEKDTYQEVQLGDLEREDTEGSLTEEASSTVQDANFVKRSDWSQGGRRIRSERYTADSHEGVHIGA
jgi:hypothetical protein